MRIYSFNHLKFTLKHL